MMNLFDESIVNILKNIFLSPITYIIPLFISIFILIKQYKKIKTIEYLLDIVRTTTHILARNHEIVTINKDGNVLYTTHSNEYRSLDDVCSGILERSKTSDEAKNTCNMLYESASGGILLEGEGNGLKDQTKKWVISKSTNIIHNTPLSDISVITITDITQYIDSCSRLSNNLQKLENFIDNFPFGIFYLDKNLKIIGANNTFASLTRINREKLIGIPIKDVIEDFNINMTDQKQNFLKIKPHLAAVFEAIIVKPSIGTSSSMQPWIIFKNQPNKNRSTDDIDFMEKDILALAPIPTIISTPSGEIISLNPAFATLIQDKVILEKDKMMKPRANILDFIHKSKQSDLASGIKKMMDSKEQIDPIEIKFSDGNITATAFINKINRVLPEKSEEFLLIQIVDISEQKRLEQQFIQSQKMQAVGQLAGGIAHDFNNLLTAMIGFCDLLLQRHSPNDTSYGDVIQIKQNANRAANLVRQLLAFSRQQTLKPKVFSITEVLAELSSLLKRLIGGNIQFQIIHGRNLWHVKADTGQFEQVIINLVVNARDAMPNGGNIIIRTRNFVSAEQFKCTCDICSAGEYVLIEVQDTGIGIEPEIVENIFEPFFSKKKDNVFGSPGTGLGLSTVYGIVKQTGGGINVISTPSKGTVFQVFLPRYIGKEQVSSKIESVPRDLSGSEKIMLVEDEEAVRIFAARALREKGYEIIESSCGDDALRLVNSGTRFDILITDVVMPQMDGPTLNNQIRKIFNDFKTIFISGYAEDTFRQELGKNSDIHFLQKPFTLRDLAVKVKEVMDEI